MKALLTDENKVILFKGKDVHTKWGYIKKEDIENSAPGNILETNTGKKVYLISAGFKDLYNKIKRQAQIILPKDVAAIIANCGINKRSRVLDAGGGSGGFSCLVASLVKKVYTYEIREDHARICRQNSEMLNLKNIKIKEKDVYEGIDERKLDLIVLDLSEPWKALNNSHKALSSGGWLVNYSPNLTQVKKLVEELEKNDQFLYIKTIELIEREWEVKGQQTRPKYKMLGHTGFLTFARRV